MITAPVIAQHDTPLATSGSAAGGHERHDDVVAGLQPGDAGADLLDHARALVPADDRQTGWGGHPSPSGRRSGTGHSMPA